MDGWEEEEEEAENRDVTRKREERGLKVNDSGQRVADVIRMGA